MGGDELKIYFCSCSSISF